MILTTDISNRVERSVAIKRLNAIGGALFFFSARALPRRARGPERFGSTGARGANAASGSSARFVFELQDAALHFAGARVLRIELARAGRSRSRAEPVADAEHQFGVFDDRLHSVGLRWNRPVGLRSFVEPVRLRELSRLSKCLCKFVRARSTGNIVGRRRGDAAAQPTEKSTHGIASRCAGAASTFGRRVRTKQSSKRKAERSERALESKLRATRFVVIDSQRRHDRTLFEAWPAARRFSNRRESPARAVRFARRVRWRIR